jgi:lipopolysaccharide transport protein LptA
MNRLSIAMSLPAVLAAATLSAQPEPAIFSLTCDSVSIDLKNNQSVCSIVRITDGMTLISADVGTANETNFENSRWQFEGNVLIEFETARLTAEHAVFDFRNNELVFGELAGDPVELTDYIEERDADVRGTADRIEYDGAAQTARMGGEAILTLAGNEYRGCDLIYHMADKSFNTGSSDCGVTFRFSREDEDDPAEGETDPDP